MSFRAADWAGLFPSMCTPFAKDDALDLAAQRDVVRFVLAAGADGIVSLGLAGEFMKLTVDERKSLCETIVAEVNGRVPVLVGVGAESQIVSIDLARHAARAGADGIVIPPPVTVSATSTMLEHYFVAVAASTELPAMVQDAPAYLGVALTPELVTRVAQAAPNVAAVKLEYGPEETAAWIARLERPLRVFSGDGGLHMLTTLRAGVVGVIPCVEFVDLFAAIFDAERRGHTDDADRLHAHLLPYLVLSLQSLNHLNACTKEVLVRRGVLTWSGLRKPAPALAPLTHTLIDGYVASLAAASTAQRAASPGVHGR